MKKQFANICYCKKNNLIRKKIPFKYNDIRRRYSFLLHSGGVISIDYCPWCGAQFSTKLDDNYFDILEKEYGIDDPRRAEQEDPNFPEEFKTDEWWKKRGL